MIFPFGPLAVELRSGEFSEAFAFTDSVPVEAHETFIRAIALFRDNQALGGEAPTIEIRAGQGALTPLVVTPSGAPGSPVKILGTNGVSAGTATCERQNNDIYLVHISQIQPHNGPWELRLQNKDPETLHFVAVSATNVADTVQPWMVWGATPGSFTPTGNPDDLSISLPGFFITQSVAVRNLGTGPLRFAETAGVPIGAPDSPAVITEMLIPVVAGDTPGQIDPHGVKDIVFGVHADGADTDVTVAHTMGTNDRLHTAKLTISVARTNFPPPPPGDSCNVDHCPGYIPPKPHPPAVGANTLGPCIQPGCGHEEQFHGFGPACKLNDGCPGFLAADGRGDGFGEFDDTVCAQPGCGHTWSESHGFHPRPRPDTACRKLDGCNEFLPGGMVGHQRICRREGCGHSLLWHSDDHPIDTP